MTTKEHFSKFQTFGSNPRLMDRRIIEEPWMTIAADIMGAITRSKSGNKYILVIQDLFSKWIEVLPLRVANGKTIREQMKERIICNFSTPRALLTDNGPEFVNKEIQALTRETGMKHLITPIYHPQGDPVERVNRVVKIMLRVYTDGDHSEWDKHLPNFKMAYNFMHHSSLQETPAFANYGRQM